MIPGQAALMTQTLPLAQTLAPPVGKEGDRVLETKSVTTQLQPDTHSGFESKVATPEFKAAAARSAEAGQAAVDAAAAAAQGAPADVVAAQPAPTVAAQPMPAPSGQGLTGGIPQMDTRPAQEEANRAALAANAKEQADAEAAERARVAAQAQQRMDLALKRYEEAGKEYDAKKSPKTLKEEKGWVLNVLGAIAAGMGAYGSAKTGTPNFALQIMDNEQKAYDERKRAEMESAWQSYQMAHKNLTEADKDAFIDKQMGRYLAGQKAQLSQLEQAAKVALARFPDIQMKVIAEAKAKQAELEDKKLKTAQETGVKTVTGGKSTRGQVEVSVGPAGEGQVRAPQVSGESAKKAMFASKILDSVKYIRNENASGLDLTDDDLRKIQDNINSIRSQADNAVKGLDKPMWISAMKKAGLTAERLTEGIPDSRAPLALAYLEATGAAIRDDSGAAITNYEDLGTAMKNMPQPGEGKKTRNFKLDRLEQDGQKRMRAAGPEAVKLMTGRYPEGYEYLDKRKPVPAASVPAEPAKKTGKELANSLSTDDLAWAKKAKAMKPSDPGYEKAQSWLKSKGLK